MVDLRGIFQDRAIGLLIEDSPSEAIVILRDDQPLTPEFREALAKMLEGSHESGVSLHLKFPRGRPSKARTKSARDYDIYQAIEEYAEQNNKSIYNACLDLAPLEGLGAESLRKSYQRIKSAIEENANINREEGN